MPRTRREGFGIIVSVVCALKGPGAEDKVRTGRRSRKPGEDRAAQSNRLTGKLL